VSRDAPFTFPAAWKVVHWTGDACAGDQHCLERITKDGAEHWRCAACGETRRVVGYEWNPTGSWCFGCQDRVQDWGTSEVRHYLSEHGRQLCTQCVGEALDSSTRCRAHQPVRFSVIERPPPGTTARKHTAAGRSSSRGSSVMTAVIVALAVASLGVFGYIYKLVHEDAPAAAAQSNSNTTTSSTSRAGFDVRTSTCADYNTYSDSERVAAGNAMLHVMANNEGIKVTDSVNNNYIVLLNNACDAKPSSLLALAASAAYTQATGG
jgi:hypothetical protein